MSRFYTIALGLALCTGAAVTANAQAGSMPASSDTSAVTTRHDRGRMHGRMRRGMERADRELFKGITLSSEQKAKVDSVRSKYRNESRSLGEQMRPDMQKARAARQSGDSAKIAEAHQSMAASREKMASLRKQELSEIRGILTPEQQATFDKNVEQLQSRMQQGRSGRKGARSSGHAGTTGR